MERTMQLKAPKPLNIRYSLYDYMTTTIAIQEDTLDLLRHLKHESGEESFDALIRYMMRKSKMQKSLFGKYKNLPSFRREELDRFD